jgi:hypothetical protein
MLNSTGRGHDRLNAFVVVSDTVGVLLLAGLRPYLTENALPSLSPVRQNVSAGAGDHCAFARTTIGALMEGRRMRTGTPPLSARKGEAKYRARA